MDIQTALRQARETRGYNKAEFGRLLGMAPTSANPTINRYESGERKPGSDMIEKWFAACACVVSYDGVGWQLRFKKEFSKKIA